MHMRIHGIVYLVNGGAMQPESNSDTTSERRHLGYFSPATKTKIWQNISLCGEN